MYRQVFPMLLKLLSFLCCGGGAGSEWVGLSSDPCPAPLVAPLGLPFPQPIPLEGSVCVCVCVSQRDRGPVGSSLASSLTPCVTLDNSPSLSGPFCKVKTPAISDSLNPSGCGHAPWCQPPWLPWHPQPTSPPHSAAHPFLGFPDHSQC